MKFLLVLILLFCVAAYLIAPQFSKNMEQSYADDAIVVVKMIGTTNRMYSLDYHGQWASGPIDNACNSAACGGAGRGGREVPGCNLVACNYLAHQDWDGKKYNFYALDASAAPSNSNPCGNFPSARAWKACAVRKTAADGDRSAPRYSAGWAYAVGDDDVLVGSLPAAGAAPVPLPEK